MNEKRQEVNKPFHILALDGGGIKGLFSAAFLHQLEVDLSLNVVDHFDLIVGTSTGGIIALALGVGISPAEIVSFYIEKGPHIFKGPGWYRRVRQVYRSAYNRELLQEGLREIFQEKRLADSVKRLVIPSYSLDSDDVYIFKTPHDPRLKRDWKVPLWKVALATSAAPTYFPASADVEDVRLIDGGVWANNPSIVGVAEAVSMFNVNLHNLKILSLGTSYAVVNRHKRLNSGGFAQWAYPVSQVLMKAQSCGAVGLAKHLVGTSNIFRIDPAVPKGVLGLDKIDKRRLYSLAAETSRHFSPTFELEFKPHIAAPYTPLVEIGRD